MGSGSWLDDDSNVVGSKVVVQPQQQRLTPRIERPFEGQARSHTHIARSCHTRKLVQGSNVGPAVPQSRVMHHMVPLTSTATRQLRPLGHTLNIRLKMSRGEEPLESEPPGAQGAKRVLSLVKDKRTRAEVLHARLAPVVNRLAWSFLGADPDRDDIVHDIYIRILRSAHTVRDPAKLEGWAARVTVNSIKNEFRRRKLRRVLSLETVEDVPSSTCHPDFEGREVLKRTTHILEKMPVGERIPFTLQLLEQKSVEEIAELCDSSERTIKRRLKSARERFTRLAENDPLLRSRISQTPEGEH